MLFRSHESVTYAEVFGAFLNLKSPDTGNRIVLAAPAGLPSGETLEARARELAPRLTPYSVDLKRYPPLMSRKVDWDINRRALTDQYSPANLLRD